MDLQRNSIEYAHVVLSNVPQNATIEASVDKTNWVTASTSGSECLVLLRGPDAIGTTGTLVPNNTNLWIRVTASPEIIVRSAGLIELY